MSQSPNTVQAPTGLIHALQLDGAGGVQQRQWSELQCWTNAEENVWLHFDYDDAESQQWMTERASMVQDELINRMSEEINQRSYVLTIVAAIFLPLGFFTGLMGINVGGMPGVNDPGAFWTVVLICAVIFVLLGSVFYWKKWF